ncbi:MAG: hypothetical protein U0T82_07630 [Bacteroidales bacterium]
MNQAELMNPIGKKVNSLLEKYEYIISLLAFLTIIFHYLHIPGATTILNLVFSAYALAMFLCAFDPVLDGEDSHFKNPQLTGIINFIYKLMCMASSVGLTSILFILSYRPGGKIMNFLSISNFSICLLAMLILQFGFKIESKAFAVRHYYRVVILFAFSIYFMVEGSPL